jgi:hypothetical protein
MILMSVRRFWFSAGLVGAMLAAVPVSAPAAAVLTNSAPLNGRIIIGWSSRGTLETATQLSGPWTTVTNATNPFTNSVSTNFQFFRLNQTVDTTTLHKKVLCGYQGWFSCPGDPTVNHWFHWSDSQTTIASNTLTFEMWPDMTEYTNQYAAPGFTYPGGAQAYLFSSQDQQTVDTHFNWMQDYGIDGVVVQRFVTDITNRPWMTNVLNHVRAAANRTGRVFAMEYDMSGAEADTNTLLNLMTNDWTWLCQNQNLTQDPRYLYQNGKPVLVIFGFSTNNFSDVTLPQKIINWFETNTIQPVTLIGSGDWWWRSENAPGWSNLFRSFNGYMPWNTGNYTPGPTITNATTSYWAADLADATNHGMFYYPQIYPGYSACHLAAADKETGFPFNEVPRAGGNCFWNQFVAVANLGLDWAYVGMFDEVDEGTAIFKVTSTPPTQAIFVTYDTDGITLPNDWYLRLTAEGASMLSGEITNSPTIPISP